jgi:hypothetical protein
MRRNLRIGRRHAVAGIGLAGAAAAIPILPSVARAAAAPDPGLLPEPSADHEPPLHESRPDAHAAHDLAPPGESERALLGPLAAGAALAVGAHRYRVAALFAARAGAIPVVLEALDGDAGARFAVEILRRDDADAVQPVARTASLALYVANGGDGSRATQEAQGLAVRALARAIEAHGTATPSLSTRAERASRHPMGVFHVPLDLAARDGSAH